MHIDSSYFTYIMCNERLKSFSNHICVADYVVNYSVNTKCAHFSSETRFVAICGLCIDSHGELNRSDIPRFLIETAGQYAIDNGLRAVLRIADRLAGKFVLLYTDPSGIFAINDASGLMSIYYHIDGGLVASNETLIARYARLSISESSRAIRAGSAFAQPMPNNLTMYDEVRVLLPNHFLNLASGKASRFFPSGAEDVGVEPLTEVTGRTVVLVDNIVREYQKHHTLVCPVTGGMDSRLVLAFMRRHVDRLNCYTFKHTGYNENTADLSIPRHLTNELGIAYKTISDRAAPKEWVEYIREEVGPKHSRNTIDLAYTFKSEFGGSALMTGDIIDQIGKSRVGQNLLKSWASAAFFVRRIGNSSKKAKEEIQSWIESIPTSRASLFDLFAWENLLGRWAAQTSMIYSALGVLSLNIFNCREVILLWMRIPRKQRTAKEIHKAILAEIGPDLMKYRCASDSLVSVLRKNNLVFFLSTYVGYYKHRRWQV